MAKIDFDESLAFVSKLAKEAGKIIAQASLNTSKNRKLSIQAKENFADLVTKYDVEVETFLKTKLHEKYPNHKFIGEESTVSKQELTDDPTWVIDPIDGTTNFIHGFPFVAISIGLLVKKQSVLGLIYAPFMDRLITAVHGQGTYYNGNQVHVSNTKDLSKALVIAEFGSDRSAQALDTKISNMRNLIEASHGIRSSGSCALNMTAVAMGNADACFEFGVHCWDMAAGEVIVREAGGVIIHPDGSEFDVMSRCLLCASSMELANSIKDKITTVPYPHD